MPISSVSARQQFASTSLAARLLRDASTSSTAGPAALANRPAGRQARRAEENPIAEAAQAEAFLLSEATGSVAALRGSRFGRHPDCSITEVVDEVSSWLRAALWCTSSTSVKLESIRRCWLAIRCLHAML